MIHELIAADGMWLTQKGEIATDLRTFQHKVVGAHATEEYWMEVSNEWKEQWKREHPKPEPAEVVE